MTKRGVKQTKMTYLKLLIGISALASPKKIFSRPRLCVLVAGLILCFTSLVSIRRLGTIGRRSEPLTSLLLPTTEILKRKKGNNLKVRYVEVGDTDKVTGRIFNVTELEVQQLPSRAKYIAHENMLLIPNHRNSIKAGRSVTLVPADHDGIVVTSRFIVARAKIPAIYLYHILNLDIVKKRMLTLVSGSSSTEVKFDQLSEILVPLPGWG